MLLEFCLGIAPLISLYAVLGLEESAPESAVEEAFQSIKERLCPASFKDGSAARTQAQKAMKAIENAQTR